MLNLVFHAKDDLQRELLAELYRPDVMDDILKESDNVSLLFSPNLSFSNFSSFPFPFSFLTGCSTTEGMHQDGWSFAESRVDCDEYLRERRFYCSPRVVFLAFLPSAEI